MVETYFPLYEYTPAGIRQKVSDRPRLWLKDVYFYLSCETNYGYEQACLISLKNKDNNLAAKIYKKFLQSNIRDEIINEAIFSGCKKIFENEKSKNGIWYAYAGNNEKKYHNRVNDSESEWLIFTGLIASNRIKQALNRNFVFPENTDDLSWLARAIGYSGKLNTLYLAYEILKYYGMNEYRRELMLNSLYYACERNNEEYAVEILKGKGKYDTEGYYDYIFYVTKNRMMKAFQYTLKICSDINVAIAGAKGAIYGRYPDILTFCLIPFIEDIPQEEYEEFMKDSKKIKDAEISLCLKSLKETYKEDTF